MLDEPTPYYGGLTAAPTFSQIMEFALRDQRIAPARTTVPLPAGYRLGGTLAIPAPVTTEDASEGDDANEDEGDGDLGDGEAGAGEEGADDGGAVGEADEAEDGGG